MARATRWVFAAALLCSACSSSGSTSGTTQPASTTTDARSAAVLPRVDLIKEAVKALETKLGGPQQFFEVNATTSLVNMIVALNDGKLAQPWVYLGGSLSSTEPGDATGFSFAGSALDFEPEKVFSQLQAQLPSSTPDLFFVEGGAGGLVRYSVAVTSTQGGQLIVVVGPDGKVISVDPN
ncbi:MAG: hypothetical protein ABI949_16135 [Ilumatobacteraceae bacterium]